MARSCKKRVTVLLLGILPQVRITLPALSELWARLCGCFIMTAYGHLTSTSLFITALAADGFEPLSQTNLAHVAA